MENLQQVMQYYNSNDSRYLYLDKKIDIKGINYKSFIKLKYESINNKYIKDIYTVDGWYVLFYLMSYGVKGEYIYTSLTNISEITNIRVPKIKEILSHLISKSIIFISTSLDDVKNNDHMHIVVGYNNNCSPYEQQEGYRPIPIEFIKRVLPKLTPSEWAIFCTICVRYNYFQVVQKQDEVTGEIRNCYYREHYGYPTIQSMVNELDICKETIIKCVKQLEILEYIKKIKSDPLFLRDEEGKQVIKGGNNRYNIPLFERPEYIYHYIYMPDDKMTDIQKVEWEYIKKKGFENIATSSEQDILKNKNLYYMLNYYKPILEKYAIINSSLNIRDYKEFREVYLYEFKV